MSLYGEYPPARDLPPAMFGAPILSDTLFTWSKQSSTPRWRTSFGQSPPTGPHAFGVRVAPNSLLGAIWAVGWIPATGRPPLRSMQYMVELNPRAEHNQRISARMPAASGRPRLIADAQRLYAEGLNVDDIAKKGFSGESRGMVSRQR